MNLEEFFYSCEADLKKFPNRHNYVAKYKEFKQFMDEQIHPNVVYMTHRLESEVDLNDHSSKHIEMIIRKVSMILWEENDTCNLMLNPYEMFILLMAIQIHDAGHIYEGRYKHAENAYKLLSQLNQYTVTTPESVLINKIAKAHSGKNDPIGNLGEDTEISSIRVRTKLLAALLRFGDELADEYSRASSYRLDQNMVSEKSKLFHAYSQCLYSFTPRVSSHNVLMQFSLNKSMCVNTYKKTVAGKDKDIYLLDEIYTRTTKTFLECMYFNRFVPVEIRLSSVSVTVSFYDEKALQEFYPSIKYRIEEKGYPTINEDSIFSLCGNDLIRNGKQLNGTFVREEVEKLQTND
jgi:hypothetical protein